MSIVFHGAADQTLYLHTLGKIDQKTHGHFRRREIAEANGSV